MSTEPIQSEQEAFREIIKILHEQPPESSIALQDRLGRIWAEGEEG